MNAEPSADAGTSSLAPRTSAGGPSASLDSGATLPRVVAAVLAWALAVAPVAFARGSGLPAKGLALLALAAGAVGPFVAVRGAGLARHVGVSAFLAMDVATWLLVRNAIGPQRLEPLRAGLGALAFGVWALAWGDVFRAASRAEGVQLDGPPLPARSRLPALAVPIAALSILSALAVAGLAWRIADPSRALAGQAASLASAVALVSAGATIAISREPRRLPSAKLPSDARRTVALLVVLVLAGGLVVVFRGLG